MATATAKRGIKGTKATVKPKPKAPPKIPPKKRASRTKGSAKDPAANSAFLQTVKAENPDITSEEFAIKFNLPVDECARHRAFINQYVKDYNVKAAALRMGYPEATAWDTGKIMLGYAFAQLYLAELQRAATVESVVSVGQIMAAAWKEANRPDTIRDGCTMTNSSTRIAAITLCAKASGMLTPKPKEEAVVIRRIMYVGEKITDWEAQARASQKALKLSTIIDV